ncbi:hypothetical protein EYF80_057462 [Liparis tanakae]|uniref:Uncharacterized protein n=1 Tax=Liparis tanakae TaxID=230148 RepID=A0A4Z2ETY9_9TELE|nr:hypothetical protein EYF80_057462 [Liparis tanakae]
MSEEEHTRSDELFKDVKFYVVGDIDQKPLGSVLFCIYLGPPASRSTGRPDCACVNAAVGDLWLGAPLPVDGEPASSGLLSVL